MSTAGNTAGDSAGNNVDNGVSREPIAGAERVEFGPITMDISDVGDARIKRIIYPAGMRWSVDLKPLVGTEQCEHAHGGFLAEGSFQFEFDDGCVQSFTAPAFVEVAPGHDAEITSEVPAVFIEVDFKADTVARLGLPQQHSH